MKLVVPLTIPSIQCTLVTIIDSRSTFTTGIVRRRWPEPQPHAVSLGCAERLVAVLGQLCRVGRHHRLAGSEQRQHVLTRGLDPAHHLVHHGDGGIVAEPCEVGCQHPFRRVGVAGGIAHQRRGHLDRLAGDALDRLGALPQQPMDGGADGAVSEQSDPDG
jgi:hypothetical protein